MGKRIAIGKMDHLVQIINQTTAQRADGTQQNGPDALICEWWAHRTDGPIRETVEGSKEMVTSMVTWQGYIVDQHKMLEQYTLTYDGQDYDIEGVELIGRNDQMIIRSKLRET